MSFTLDLIQFARGVQAFLWRYNFSGVLRDIRRDERYIDYLRYVAGRDTDQEDILEEIAGIRCDIVEATPELCYNLLWYVWAEEFLLNVLRQLQQQQQQGSQ